MIKLLYNTTFASHPLERFFIVKFGRTTGNVARISPVFVVVGPPCFQIATKFMIKIKLKLFEIVYTQRFNLGSTFKFKLYMDILYSFTAAYVMGVSLFESRYFM